MTLQELMRNTLWEPVEAKLADLYPETQDKLNAYRELYHYMSELDTEPTDFKLNIQKVWEQDDKEFWWDVYGETPDGQQWAIEFTPWEQWMSMEICPDIIREAEITNAAIVAHSLWEMTYAGMNQEQIRELFQALQEAVDEAKDVFNDEEGDD